MVREDSAIQPLVDYIEKNLKKGYKLESLKWALINQKHSKIEIEKAIKIIQARTPAAKEEDLKEMQEASIAAVKKEEIFFPKKKSFWKRFFGQED